MTDDEDRQHIIERLRQIRNQLPLYDDRSMLDRAITLLTNQGGLPCGK